MLGRYIVLPPFPPSFRALCEEIGPELAVLRAEHDRCWWVAAGRCPRAQQVSR